MLLHMLKSKIHCATVTEANLHYMGSIALFCGNVRLTDNIKYKEVK